jgi:hypothetical protein
VKQMIRKFNEDDRIIIDNEESSHYKKTGRITKAVRMENVYIVQLDQDRKYYHVKDDEMKLFIEEEDLQSLINFSLDIKDKELFMSWTNKLNKPR